MNERNLQPGEESLDADLVFAASGCAYAAQRSLEHELRWAVSPDPQATGPRNPEAKDGNPLLALWLRSFQSRTDWEGHGGQRVLSAAKYLMRALVMAPGHSEFLSFIDSHPLLRACVARDPRLLERHLHRFVNRRWHRFDRREALLTHYRLLLQRWPRQLFEDVYVRGRAALGELALRNDRRVSLRLRPATLKDCEGELTIELNEADGSALYHLTLTVIDDDTLAIGCLQGPRGWQARERVRELTRDMHGMRPKQLLLVLAYALAGQLGLSRILAVGNDAHPLAGKRLFSDYDSYWLEQSGERMPAGWFLLPEVLQHRSELEQESKRRAQFRRRADLRWGAVKLLNDALRPAAWWSDATEADADIESLPPLHDVTKAVLWTNQPTRPPTQA